MDQDFFGSSNQQTQIQFNHTQEEQFQNFQEYENNQVEQIHQSQPITSQYVNLGQNINYNQNFYQQQESNNHEQQLEQFNRVKREEEQISQRLRNKYIIEQKQKESRKQKAKTELLAFLNERQNQRTKKYQINKQKQLQHFEQASNKVTKSSWQKIAQNIAVKQGQYPGKKDVTRMKQAIINKKYDARQ